MIIKIFILIVLWVVLLLFLTYIFSKVVEKFKKVDNMFSISKNKNEVFIRVKYKENDNLEKIFSTKEINKKVKKAEKIINNSNWR